MRRSQYFNRKHPAPVDNFVYPHFKQYQELQRDIVSVWKADLLSGRLGMRGYIDVKDSRIEIRGDSRKGYTPTITFVPMVGKEAMEQVAFYKRFLDTYAKTRDDVLKIITYIISGDFAVDHAEMGKIARYNHLTSYKMVINRGIMLIKTMVTAMAKGKLEMYHLEFISGDTTTDPKVLSEMFRDMGIAELLSDEFERGGLYYDGADPLLIQSFWNYAKFQYGLTLPEGVSAENWENAVYQDMMDQIPKQ
jgi:hypothetical protein